MGEVPVVAAAKEAASDGPSLGAIAPFGVVAAGGAGFAAFRSGLIGGKEEREEAQEKPKKGKGKKAPVVSKAKAAAAAKAAAKAAALAKKKGGKKTSGGKGTIAVSKPAAAPSEGLPVIAKLGVGGGLIALGLGTFINFYTTSKGGGY